MDERRQCTGSDPSAGLTVQLALTGQVARATDAPGPHDLPDQGMSRILPWVWPPISSLWAAAASARG
jgi:hypothetical protein